MSDYKFLDLDAVIAIHAQGLADHGGQDGIRDAASLESAVMHPQNVAIYTQGDLLTIAAAYAFHIAEAQAFIDGNKRAGMGAALTFLRLNGYRVKDQSEELYRGMIDVSARRINRDGLAEILRRLSFPAR